MNRKPRRWPTNFVVGRSLADTPRQQIEAVFEFMHRHILRGGYDLAYTDLRRILDEGRFNCLSATVLFDYLAGRVGVRLPGRGDAASRNQPRSAARWHARR